MHFVDKQNGVTAALLQHELRTLHRFTYVLDAREYCGDSDEICIERMRHQTRERRFPDAGRSPQYHRVRLAGLECETQGLARSEQMRLTDDVVERARPQALCERYRGCEVLAESCLGRQVAFRQELQSRVDGLACDILARYAFAKADDFDLAVLIDLGDGFVGRSVLGPPRNIFGMAVVEKGAHA